jgi:hypothetical protein
MLRHSFSLQLLDMLDWRILRLVNRWHYVIRLGWNKTFGNFTEFGTHLFFRL